MRVFIPLPLVLGLLALMCQPAGAQPPGSLLITWDRDDGGGLGSGTGNWALASNWSPDRVPDKGNEDSAVINGGGTAQVNSVVSQVAGGLVLGQGEGATGGGAATDVGTLEVLGGSIMFDVESGAPADGSVRVGQGSLATGGLGTLRMTGGSLTSASLSSAGDAASLIELSGSATLSTGTATFGRMMRIIGPDVDFSATGAVEFQDTSTYVPEITGMMHSTITTASTATLGGTLQLDFTSYTPTSTDTWDLVEATSITGSFNVVPDPAVSLPAGLAFDVQTINGGLGQIARLLAKQLLVLNVNRNTGEVTLSNPGSSGVEFDGYGIQSAVGSLNSSDAVWNSLEEQPGVAGPDWAEANPTTNHLAELKSAGTGTIGGGASWSLGNVFNPPAPTEFGQDVEDLVFSYNDPVADATVTSVVQYTGSANVNNLVLFVNPTTGEVHISNPSPFTVSIDGYTISSNGGSLNSNPNDWTSFQEQLGNSWTEANLSDNRVSELQSSGKTTLAANNGMPLSLGVLFNTADPQDLDFQFLRADLQGDYNDNGVVDAADYTIFRDHLGEAFQLTNEVTTPGMVTIEDYTAWVERFGNTERESMARPGVVLYEAAPGSGSGSLVASAVPEPASWLLACLCGVLLSVLRPANRKRMTTGL